MGDLRRRFFRTLEQLAEKDKRIILLINDVGYSFFESFKNRFPKQFLNCGIQEQNMMGIAAGLAISGLKPYVYSMINFVLMRPFEQLRNDIILQKRDVKIIGVKGSEAYKFLGPSHNLAYKDEDLAILGDLPIAVCLPTSEAEVETMLKESYQSMGPCYTRL